jgi:hypothetical protein
MQTHTWHSGCQVRICGVGNLLERVSRPHGKSMYKKPLRLQAARGATKVPIQNTR